MPETLKITEVRNYRGELQVGAVVIVIPEEAFANVAHTPEGQDFPPTPFLRANKTNSQGACDITIPVEGAMVTVAFISADLSSGGVRVHV